MTIKIAIHLNKETCKSLNDALQMYYGTSSIVFYQQLLTKYATLISPTM